jgi:hypothetical protein
MRGGWRWPQHHESETLRRWLHRALAPAGCRAGVAVGGGVCIPRGNQQGAHSCGGAGWWDAIGAGKFQPLITPSNYGRRHDPG